MKHIRLFFGSGMISLLGCAPSVSSLVAQNHFDEAFAAVSATSPADASDRTLVTRAAFDAANPAIHLHVFGPKELEAQLGPVARHVEDGWVTRIHTTVTPAPFDAEVHVELRTAEGTVAELDRSLEGLATKTGERERAEAARAALENEDQRQHRAQLDADARTRERAASWDRTKQTAWILTNIFTAGTPLIVDWLTRGKIAPTSGVAPPTVDRPPPRARALPRSAAPDAARLQDALETHLPEHATHTDDVHVFRQLPSGAPLSLRIVVLMRARGPSDFASAVLATETTVKLPNGPSLEARLAALFPGDREIRVADLGTARVIAP